MTSRDAGMTLGISKIVRELAVLREREASGTYVVSSEDGEEAHVSVDHGEVSAIRYRGQQYPPRRLLEALGGVRAIATGFIEAASLSKSMQPPLGLANDFNLADSDARRVICKHLVQILGPIASHICDEKSLPNQSFENLLALVSQEIDAPDRAHAFRADVRREFHGEVGAARFGVQKFPPQQPVDGREGGRVSATNCVQAAIPPESRRPLARPNDFHLADTEARRIICNHLVDILGPFANVICSERAVPNQSVEDLLSLISLEIEDLDRAQAFRAAVRRELARG
jgi:hypothetical protein